MVVIDTRKRKKNQNNTNW